MKVWVDSDEWYPVYDLSMPDEYHGANTEVSEEFYTKYLGVMKAFDEMQEELRKLDEEVK